jgi:hypothetical protein
VAAISGKRFKPINELPGQLGLFGNHEQFVIVHSIQDDGVGKNIDGVMRFKQGVESAFDGMKRIAKVKEGIVVRIIMIRQLQDCRLRDCFGFKKITKRKPLPILLYGR